MLRLIDPDRPRRQQATGFLNEGPAVRADVAADDGYNLRVGVPVGRHGEMRRELDAHHDCLALRRGVADERRYEHALGEGRIGLPP